MLSVPDPLLSAGNVSPVEGITSKLPLTTPLLQFDYLKGHEIPTKHKEAIRRLN
jgi:hypothetical protein